MKLLLAIALTLAAVSTRSAAAPDASLGEVVFENSGAPAAQQPFRRGLALLHNFEYERAIKAFREAQSADPGFALAYWGEAMSRNRSVWMSQDTEEGRAALAKLGPSREARLATARTARERAYLEAVEVLYGEGSKEVRDQAYSDRMAAVHAAYPADVDAAAFYALSLLGLAHQGRDYPLYMRSAAVLEEYFPRNSRHPGVLHYLIHSYDDPIHAPLGLRAARLYGAVAGDAPHALHMTSHIFIAMGMWEDVIAANLAGAKVAARLRAAAGQPVARCSHGREWLVYAYYQVRKPGEADALRRGCLIDAKAELASGVEPRYPTGPSVKAYVDMLVRKAVDTGSRPADEGLVLPEGRYAAQRFSLAYVDLLLAGSDVKKIADARARLAGLSDEIAKAGKEEAAGAKRREIILAQAAGLERLRSGDAEAGLVELRRAAETERSTAPDFGPPMIEKPSYELLGDELLRLGRPADAAAAYRAALLITPGRLAAQSGLTRATVR